jgi:hypothetical protein
MIRVFRRGVLVALVVAVTLMALTAAATAAPDGITSPAGTTNPTLLALIGNNDLFSVVNLAPVLNPTGATPTQHYGPYTSGSPDSGTCGNNWANDTFDRDFTVRSNGDGTYAVVEQFKNGAFVTNDGLSPGACETTYTNHGSTITGGKTGSMHGYFIISNTGPPTSTSPYCDASNPSNTDCTTATFIETHFGCIYQVTCSVTTYFDHYAAGDQMLLYHQWKNASADRGGDDGDVASS